MLSSFEKLSFVKEVGRIYRLIWGYQFQCTLRVQASFCDEPNFAEVAGAKPMVEIET